MQTILALHADQISTNISVIESLHASVRRCLTLKKFENSSEFLVKFKGALWAGAF